MDHGEQSRGNVRFLNTLTGSSVIVTVNPEERLTDIIKARLLMYNLNAFAYQYSYVGRQIEMNSTLGEAGVLSTAHASTSADQRFDPPAILMIFPDGACFDFSRRVQYFTCGEIFSHIRTIP